MYQNRMSNVIPTLSTERGAKRLLKGQTDLTFNRHQIAFLEDLLMNKACMPALLKERRARERNSENNGECLDCAGSIESILGIIKHRRE
jgi:hypothetical protein